METIDTGYNLLLVALSFVISLFGSYTALQLAGQATAGDDARGGQFWISCAALAMGGGAIWSMHFIGMAAFELGVRVRYDLALTLGSLALAVVVTGIGFFVVARNATSRTMLLGAGTVMGLGVAGMHYVGMAAMRMPAGLSYRPLLVGVSVIIGIVASACALWLAFNLKLAWHRVAGALVMATGVCGMHYTGMAAAVFTTSGQTAAPTSTALTPETLAYAVFLLALVLLGFGLAISLGERTLAESPTRGA